MVNKSVSQEWLHASEKSLLQTKTLQGSDFPDPLSYYSLYCVIINKETLNRMIGYPFMPFHGRASVREILKGDGRDGGPCENYGYWIEILEEFLGSPPLVEHKKDRKGGGELTHFGAHMFPELMRAFGDLYRQNDHLRKVATAYVPPEI